MRVADRVARPEPKAHASSTRDGLRVSRVDDDSGRSLGRCTLVVNGPALRAKARARSGQPKCRWDLAVLTAAAPRAKLRFSLAKPQTRRWTMLRRKIGMLLLALGVAALAFAAGSGVRGASAATKTSLTIGVEGEPPTLDLTKTASTFSVWMTLYSVLEPLVQTNPTNLKVEPLLAQSWKVTNGGKVYTFVLRKGARFSTGAPVTAADVVFSYQMMSAPTSPQAPAFVPMTSVRALNKSTVRVTLSRRSNSWLQNMSYRAGVVFSKADFASMATDPIGSGPYKIASWTHGDNIELVPNPHYSGSTKAQMKQVYYKFIADPSAAVNALRAGDIDVLENLLARDQGASLKAAGFIVSPDASPRVHALFFNVDQAPLNDVRVRQAISYAIDKRSIRNALSGGYGIPVGSWISRGEPFYSSFEDYPYNVAKAKQLLTSAGFPNGLSFPMTIIANNISAQQGELLALELRQAGINVKLQTVDVGTFLDQVLNKRNFVSGVVAAASPTILSTNFANGKGWFTNWNNATFDADIAKADTAASQKAANALYSAAAKLLAADAPIVPLYNDVNLTIRPKNLKGWVPFRIDQAIDVRRVRWAG